MTQSNFRRCLGTFTPGIRCHLATFQQPKPISTLSSKSNNHRLKLFTIVTNFLFIHSFTHSFTHQVDHCPFTYIPQGQRRHANNRCKQRRRSRTSAKKETEERELPEIKHNNIRKYSYHKSVRTFKHGGHQVRSFSPSLIQDC